MTLFSRSLYLGIEGEDTDVSTMASDADALLTLLATAHQDINSTILPMALPASMRLRHGRTRVRSVRARS